MELAVSGWARDHGEKIIARRDLTEARFLSFNAYARPEVYVKFTEGKETSPFGVRAVQNGNVELRFYAKITLNGEYLVRYTMTRKEVASLFLSQYDDCALQDLLDVIYEVRETSAKGTFAPVMLKRVTDIGLSDGTVSWLTNNNIWQVGDLVQKTVAEMRNLPNFDDQSFFELWNQIIPLGLQFGMRVHGWSAIPSMLLRRLDEFDLSIRTANSLKNENIVCLGDLVQRKEEELLRTPNFGRKSLLEIKQLILIPLGLHFGMELPNWPLSPL